MKRIFAIILFIFLASCSSQNIVTIGDTDISVEFADTIDEQALGLMYRTSLEENHGMLFVFDSLQPHIFWMKNTELTLDIIFIDSEGVIVDIKENFEPCDYEPCEMYTSKPAMYALEVNGGFVAKHGVEVGDIVKIND